MKKPICFIIFFLTLNINAFGQSISVNPHNTSLSDTLGSEMIFAVDVTNISDAEQTVYIVRTINNLPSGWTSSLCFDACFPPEIDSIISTPEYGSSPLQPDSIREISVHVFPWENAGQGNIQIKIGSTRDSISFLVDINAVVEPTSVDNIFYKPDQYQLLQNYPNPFNPSTKIAFNLLKKEHVTVTVYNSIGQKVKTLLNRTLEAGRHIVDFNAEDLTAGVYYYRVTTADFVRTKKMILLK